MRLVAGAGEGGSPEQLQRSAILGAAPAVALPGMPQLHEAYFAAKAEAGGIDFTSLTLRQQKTWRHQVATLEAYAVTGEFSSAAAIAGCHRTNVNYWRNHDTMGFRARLAEVHDRFSDRLEAIAHNRVELQKANDNPGLLMFLLNANRPEKYRPAATPVDETVKSVLATLQAMGAQSLADRDLQR